MEDKRENQDISQEKKDVKKMGEETKDDKKKDINWKKSLLSWVLIIITAFLLAKLVTVFVIEKVKTPTGSMEPTILTTDRLLLFKLAYLFSDPERGDIVVIKDKSKSDDPLLKRIIGLPGETISFKDGAVYIDGKLLEEEYLNGIKTLDKGTTIYQIPEDCYFVMGDNRGPSVDSRKWEHPFVNEKNIEGKIFLRYSPSIEFIE